MVTASSGARQNPLHEIERAFRSFDFNWEPVRPIQLIRLHVCHHAHEGSGFAGVPAHAFSLAVSRIPRAIPIVCPRQGCWQQPDLKRSADSRASPLIPRLTATFPARRIDAVYRRFFASPPACADRHWSLHRDQCAEPKRGQRSPDSVSFCACEVGLKIIQRPGVVRLESQISLDLVEHERVGR